MSCWISKTRGKPHRFLDGWLMADLDMKPTADLCDQFDAQLDVCEPVFRHFGGVAAFAGQVETLKLFEDNSLVRTVLEEPADGRVLVIDGGGSRRCALVGDRLAELAVDNGWAGIVVYGCIRDSKAIAGMSIGVMALGTHPRKSDKQGVGQRGLALRFAAVTFHPGDFLYADEDGIVVARSRLS
jgi:regulator of ribonuclease activity A